jgi:hypothetical protein
MFILNRQNSFIGFSLGRLMIHIFFKFLLTKYNLFITIVNIQIGLIILEDPCRNNFGNKKIFALLKIIFITKVFNGE